MKRIAFVVGDSNLLQKGVEYLKGVGAVVYPGSFSTSLHDILRDRVVDLALVDFHLEDQLGDLVVRDLILEYPFLPFLMLCKEPDPWFEERAKVSGAKGVVLYSQVESGEFLKILREYLHIDRRVSLFLPLVYYLTESKEKVLFKGSTVDLSFQGLSFTTDQSFLEVGMLVDLRILFKGEEVYLRGEVKRIVPKERRYTVGVRIVGFRKGDEGKWRRWIVEGEKSIPKGNYSGSAGSRNSG
jgi:hypothetical protein